MRNVRPLAAMCLLAALLVLAGCKPEVAQKDAEPQPQTKKPPVTTKKPVTPVPKIGPVPANIIVYGGVKSFDGAIKQAQKLVNRFQPMPELANMVEQGLVQGLGLKSLDWLDRGGNLKFAVGNPKEQKKPFAIVVPTLGPDKLKAALPESKKEGVDGNALHFQVEGKDVYVNFVGNLAVFTPKKDVFAKLKPFVAGPLAKYAVTGEVEVVAPVANITTIFKPELDAARAKAKASMVDPSVDQIFPGLGPIVVKEVEMVFGFIESVEAAAFRVAASDRSVQLRFTIQPKGGTTLAKFAADLPNRKFTLLDRLPKDTYCAFLGTVNSAFFKEWVQLGPEFLAGLLKLSAEEKKQLGQLMDKVMALETGESIMALHPQGAAPIAMTFVEGSSDGMASRKLAYQLLDMLVPKALVLLNDFMQKMDAKLPPIKAKTTKELIEYGVKQLQKAVPALAVKMESKPHGKGVLDYLTITADLGKLQLGPAEKGLVEALLGSTVSVALGAGKDVTLMTLGPKAVEQAKAAMDGKGGFHQNASWLSAQKAMTPNPAFVLYLSVADGLRAFKELPPLAPMKSQLESLPANEAYTISVGGAGDVAVVLDFPLATTVALFKMLQPLMMKKKEVSKPPPQP